VTARTCRSCGKPRRPGTGAHGWCHTCTARWYRAGRPDTGPPPPYAQRQADRRENYDWLRSQGLDALEVAARLGLTPFIARHEEDRRAAAGLPSQYVPLPGRIITCASCGERKPHKCHGWCSACYQRWNSAGRPDTGPPEPTPPGQTTALRHALNRALREGGWVA
jgi:hypothetical protein